MKFIRSNRIKDRIIDLATKAVLFLVTGLICLWMISGAKAEEQKITEINQSKNQDGTYTVEFKFSSSLTKEDVALDFQRNFIQVSLKNVSAFPARTKTLNHPGLDKVFTYQYQPDLARARILLKSQASAVQDKTTWDIKDNSLSIQMGSLSGPQVAVAAKKPQTAMAKKNASLENIKDSLKSHAAATSTKSQEQSLMEAEDDRLVNELINETKNPVVAAKAEEKKNVLANTEDQPLFAPQAATGIAAAEKTGGSPLTKIAASLLMIIGIIGAGALAFRRFVLGKGLSLTRHGRMIEVSIELSVIGKVVDLALKDLDEAWAPVHKTDITFVRIEVNPQFVGLVPPSDVVISTTFEVELEHASGTIAIVVPYQTLEPIKEKLNAGFQPEGDRFERIWTHQLHEHLTDTFLNCRVNLGETNLTVGDLVNLNIGDVIPLSQDADGELELFVENSPKFKCLFGVSRGNRAIQVTRAIEE